MKLMNAWVWLCAAVVALAGGAEAGLFSSLTNFISDSWASLTGTTARSPRKAKMVKHKDGVQVVDFSQGGLPKVVMGGRVMDLVNGIQFDDILQDTPDEIRPPGAVVFFNSSDPVCMKKYTQMGWERMAESKMPARERLFAARYDVYSAPRRPWYKFTPEMDLEARLGVKSCPELVFIPRKCNGLTEWCSRGEDPEQPGVELVGCENFKEQCTGFKSWDGKGSMKDWLLKNIEAEGEPEITSFLKTYEATGRWIRARDTTSADNHLRNMYLSQAFPAFTKYGFEAIPIPKELNDWLLKFHADNEKYRKTEYWNSDSTQMSFHETVTTFIDMDRARSERARMANKYVKPLVEKWSGVKDLELTSFYGMREYPDGAILKNHVDRIDTHVLSVTFSVIKGDPEKSEKHPWPLEVVQWTGDHVRYSHPAGTMILYESSKLPHGRPYRNKGGIHVGCFCHFKPMHMHGTDAAKWDEIVRTARRNQNDHTQWSNYRSQPSVEPKLPVYSKIVYGQGSSWSGAEKQGKDEEDDDDGNMFSAKFENRADREMEVYWESDDGSVVHQGSLGEGSNFVIKTFPFHKFFFAEKGSDKPVPGGYMTMDKGRNLYQYKTKK
uniref:Prolyl 4-hydroxylase alpha subunit domain-containing protein n=1 Tax=Mucochytrium quahogii TaxID=96639 RepID=A0A7S2S776_9STRA|mmetsp:Transcript_35500/g.56818  ORF Transcript_35500/g.56818 Transcript_35500/m.56818 type:complete len:608 (+) Transcript_35500:3264-5087(+)